MSLTSVHLIVIVLSTALLVWLGVWGLDGYAAGRGFLDALLGASALVASAGLGAYAWAFGKKMRRVGPR